MASGPIHTGKLTCESVETMCYVASPVSLSSVVETGQKTYRVCTLRECDFSK